MNSINPQNATEIARDLYDINASAHPLDGEYDSNFHLITDTDESFILKIMHPDQQYDAVGLQCQALQHLAKKAPHLHLPQVKTTQSGDAIATFQLTDGTTHLVWLLTYVPGKVLARVKPHTHEMLGGIGVLLGQIDLTLTDFSHSAAQRDYKWDLAQALWITDFLDYVDDLTHKAMVQRYVDDFADHVAPTLSNLRKSIIHNDANDHNILIDRAYPNSQPTISIIDFGDLIYTHTISEVAIAAAYALLGKSDPLLAAAQVVKGYHSVFPLQEDEIALLYHLICMRLSVSVVNSAYRKTLEPDDSYITISERPAWEALERLSQINPNFAHYTFRSACGLPPVPHSETITRWLQSKQNVFAPILDIDLRAEPCLVLDLSVGSLMLGADPAAVETTTLTDTIFNAMQAAKVNVGVGRYNEARLRYASPNFSQGTHPTDERRTIHLGIDLFVEAGASIYAPLDGIVHMLANNTDRLDYGPLVILQHHTDDHQPFYTLYGHLGEEIFDNLSIGQKIECGQPFATIGSPPTNGDWPPHLHFQLITDLLDLGQNFPGVAYASQQNIWTSLSPDPNFIIGIAEHYFPVPIPDKSATFEARRTRLGGNLSLSYHEPLKMVRGWMQYLYDETGRAFLDVYNNVPHVGHSHPHVVKAAQAQMGLLNTNTRYLHHNITRYAERLTALMPASLNVCYFLNSASEANELAIRLARAYTGHYDMIVLDAAYHGHTNTLIDISPYKFNGPGGGGAKSWVHVAPIPDDYRGSYKRDDPQRGEKYAQHVAQIIDDLQHNDAGIAAFIAETLPSVGGQIVLPPNYLSEVYRHILAAGGVTIADEVQVGFGRLGDYFWGFEMQNVIPDIVVLGKPIGNSHPLAAVVTTREIADTFDNGMEFFSTFGGNPVACAVGLAVLDVLEEENLPQNAAQVGSYLLKSLHDLMEIYPTIGDVRGSGFFLGIELVLDRQTLEPAAEIAAYVVNRLRECGILAGTDGPLHNVIKIRPPMIFTQTDAEFFLATLHDILDEDLAKVQP